MYFLSGSFIASSKLVFPICLGPVKNKTGNPSDVLWRNCLIVLSNSSHPYANQPAQWMISIKKYEIQ
jgi:hypothetical protein